MEVGGEVKKRYTKLDQYTAEANLICKYKLETLKDVKSYKEKSMDNLRDLYNETDYIIKERVWKMVLKKIQLLLVVKCVFSKRKVFNRCRCKFF